MEKLLPVYVSYSNPRIFSKLWLKISHEASIKFLVCHKIQTNNSKIFHSIYTLHTFVQSGTWRWQNLLSWVIHSFPWYQQISKDNWKYKHYWLDVTYETKDRLKYWSLEQSFPEICGLQVLIVNATWQSTKVLLQNFFSFFFMWKYHIAQTQSTLKRA